MDKSYKKRKQWSANYFIEMSIFWNSYLILWGSSILTSHTGRDELKTGGDTHEAAKEMALSPVSCGPNCRPNAVWPVESPSMYTPASSVLRPRYDRRHQVMQQPRSSIRSEERRWLWRPLQPQSQWNASSLSKMTATLKNGINISVRYICKLIQAHRFIQIIFLWNENMYRYISILQVVLS